MGDRLLGPYLFLADHGHRLFGDGYFGDLYKQSAKGRPTVPARVLATTMLLQSCEGLSDREAIDRLQRDLAWQAAAGVEVGFCGFDPTVLVKTRNRLRGSVRPKRLLEDTVALARESGVMGDRARVFDSTPVYDAVATQDTVTQLRAVIRTLLRHLDQFDRPAAARVRAVLARDDDYQTPGKPPCDWNDPDARDGLVDDLIRDVMAAVATFDGVEPSPWLAEHLELMVLLCGQDVEEGDDGRFRIARRVAKDRIISTVDTEARHGHKSSDRRFDGYKAHIMSDPDGEIIEDVAVTPANAPDAGPVAGLVDPYCDQADKPVLYADAAYGGCDTMEWLDEHGFGFVIKVPVPTRRGGRWSKADFGVDHEAGTVTCPTGVSVDIGYYSDGTGIARFGSHCGGCPLRQHCTTAADGRTISIARREDLLQTQRWTQTTDPAWRADYTSTRPKVERKIGHLVRKPWGGRRARMRGVARIAGDLIMRAAVINYTRLASIGVTHTPTGWQMAPP